MIGKHRPMIGLLKILPNGERKTRTDSFTALRKKMIKWIKAIWEKLFTKKEEVAPVKEVALEKIDHCGTHLWYKKSCPDCRKAIK